MGTSLGPKYIPYTYMDPLGKGLGRGFKGLGGAKPYLNPQKYVK